MAFNDATLSLVLYFVNFAAIKGLQYPLMSNSQMDG